MQIRIVSRFRFCGRSRRLKIIIGRNIMCFWHTFVPSSWMWKKQTSASHSSTEAEIISLDAGLHMDGIPALVLWDLVVEIFHSPLNQPNKSKDTNMSQGNLSQVKPPDLRNQIPTKHTNLDLTNVARVSSNVKSSGSSAMLHVLRTKKPLLRWWSKAGVEHETCVKDPQSCFGLVVW